MRKVDVLCSMYEIINVKMGSKSPFMMFVISYVCIKTKKQMLYNMQDIIDNLIAIMLKDL